MGTLTFDTQNNIYATRLNIQWFRVTSEGIEDLGSKEFYPDNAFYFCQNKVENYNKVVITFYSLNMPKNRLKMRVIDYGYGTFFYGDELKGVKVSHNIDPISSQISINTADFNLVSKSDMEYSFLTKQPLSIYFNGVLRATSFVKSSKRTSKKSWNVKGEDYIGVMDSIPYFGGMYFGADAYDLFVDIFTVAKVPYKISESLKGVLVYGYIPFTTCRDALMQVAFATQTVVNTANSDVVNVYYLDRESKQTIPLSRIMEGQSFDDSDTVTGVEVTLHTYKSITETLEAYNADESGVGENIFVKFSEPLHDLTISYGDIVSYGTNYAVINARSGCVLKGKKYEHTTQTRRKNNPVVLASEIENVVSVTNATLVSSYNINDVLEKCYDWLVRTETIKSKIVEGKHTENGVTVYDEVVNVGDTIEVETSYLGIKKGTVTKQSFGLTGGIVVKETEMK